MNKSQEPSRLQEGSWSLWGRFLTAPSSQDACFSEVAYAIIATPEICRLHFGFRALVPQAGDLNYCRALRLGQRRYRLPVKQPHHPRIRSWLAREFSSTLGSFAAIILKYSRKSTPWASAKASKLNRSLMTIPSFKRWSYYMPPYLSAQMCELFSVVRTISVFYGYRLL